MGRQFRHSAMLLSLAASLTSHRADRPLCSLFRPPSEHSIGAGEEVVPELGRCGIGLLDLARFSSWVVPSFFGGAERSVECRPRR
eukprot:8305911-Pyramimonas_sp.AAC.1